MKKLNLFTILSILLLCSCSEDDLELDVEFNPVYGLKEAVDLGLPSGLKWANFNVGANSPKECGVYYAWGEITPKYDYSENTYSCNYKGDCISGTKYDVARAEWGNDWRMPTEEEFQELIENTIHIWGTEQGTNGCLLIGPNGNYIFFPAGGYYYKTTQYYKQEFCQYWSGTGSVKFFGSNTGVILQADESYYGRNVRPVYVGI